TSSNRPKFSTSTVPLQATLRSATVCTTASARRWPAWRCVSRSPHCCAGFPISHSPRISPTCSSGPGTSSTASSPSMVNGEPMKVKADREVCIQAGNWVTVADSLFGQDDDGFVMVLVDEVPGDEEDRAREAVKMCPSQALKIVE